MIPRIQARVGQASEPADVAGKWFFEMFLSSLGGGNEPLSMGQFGPWDTEEIAHKEMRRACKLACETIEEKMSGQKSGKYIDMKTNETRDWNERTH